MRRLSGNHEAIRRWRLKQSLGRTGQRRPEMLSKLELSEEQANEIIMGARRAAGWFGDEDEAAKDEDKE